MFKVTNITAKNFLSIGNVTQGVNFDRQDLTLVLGSNMDLGGDDTGSRNGTGKTTLINALSYALYGQALSNIKKDNLINRTNSKNMLVTVDFECAGIPYKIERGRKPNVLRFYVDSVEKTNEDDNSQGDSRETQSEIERLLNMSHEMFKHIVALNTYTEPFLSLKAADQRAIIEQLLGITLLSEKAENLKLQIKDTKDLIQQEEYKIKASQEANTRIQDQINSLKRRQTLWRSKHDEDITKFERSIAELSNIDIDVEIAAHKALSSFNEKTGQRSTLKTEMSRLELDITKTQKQITKLETEINSLTEHKCYACGQDVHDHKHDELLNSKKTDLQNNQSHLTDTQNTLTELAAAYELIEPGQAPTVYYDTEQEAHNHRMTLENLKSQMLNKQAEHDPYAEQIVEMEQQALAEIDYDIINNLTRMLNHQEFLSKLLTSKDSFIRKRIIDQNLSYLNGRLSHYLDKIGLPHTVTFLNDLTVDIQELGRELDFDNLSRGERNRLILSLSWAFRDVWESLYQPVNLLFVDELMDSGMDQMGTDNALAILKKMSREANKSIWLVSHKDELSSRVNNVLRVVKENGYTTYATDVEIT
jgi:DNA repair exonuclease SbcCD ATPase subunit